MKDYTCLKVPVLWKILLMTIVCMYSISVVSSRASGYYIDNGYQSRIQYLDPEMRREVQAEILGVLGIEQQPTPKHNRYDSPAIHYMAALYQHMQGENEDLTNDYHLHTLQAAEAKMSLENSVPTDEVLQQLNLVDMVASFENQVSHENNKQHNHFRFDFTSMEPGEVLRAAEMRLYHFTTDEIQSQALQVALHVISDDNSINHEPEVVTTISPNYEGWISLNVTGASLRWWDDFRTNHGLRLVVTDDSGSEVKARKSGFHSRQATHWHRPFLITFLNTPHKVHRARQRRSATTKKSRRGSSPRPSYSFPNRWRTTRCQRHDLYVDFKELGLDFFMFPSGFNSNFCSGRCSFPLDSNSNASNHAIIQTLVKSLSDDNYPESCCVPVTLGAISLIYLRNTTPGSEVVMKKYHNMVVKTCGCR